MTEAFSGEMNNDAETSLKILEALVNEEKPETGNKFSITKGSFNKAMTYAKAVGKIAGGGMECYGYLLKPVDSLDDIVTDIYFAPDQDAEAAYVRVSEEGVYQTSQEIEPKGYMIVGWWHSHGTMNPFHSPTDKRNFEIVLHSIAPRTMFKNKKAQFQYDKEKKEFLINGMKITGIEIQNELSNMEVIKKIERDPQAFSMVVNMDREYYLEKQTKTFISREKGHQLNQPTHPALELVEVENDVEYTLSEIEDDITEKIYLAVPRRRIKPRTNYFPAPEKNEKLAKQFRRKALKSRSSFIRSYLAAIMEEAKNPLEETQKPRKGITIKAKDLDEKLTGRVKDVATEYCLEEAYDIQTLRDEMNLKFMKEHTKGETSKAIERYKTINNTVNKHFELAISAGKALSKYSMERFTDYNNKLPHKYKNFVTHFLDNLCTEKYVSMTESLKKSEDKKFEKAHNDLFLYYDRLKIINNIMSSLIFKKDEKQFVGFLTNFAEEFEKNPKSSKLDEMIEQELIPLTGKENNEKTLKKFRDRKNYERKGILPIIKRGIRRYLGGGPYAGFGRTYTRN